MTRSRSALLVRLSRSVVALGAAALLGCSEDPGPAANDASAETAAADQATPTIVISQFAKRGFVDHTTYDTSSILATIEKRWNLLPLTSRDQNALPMLSAFAFTR